MTDNFGTADDAENYEYPDSQFIFPERTGYPKHDDNWGLIRQAVFDTDYAGYKVRMSLWVRTDEVDTWNVLGELLAPKGDDDFYVRSSEGKVVHSKQKIEEWSEAIYLLLSEKEAQSSFCGKNSDAGAFFSTPLPY